MPFVHPPRAVIQDIPGYNTWVTIIPEQRGWSADQKFHLVDEAGQHLLLRLADSTQYDKKAEEFFWMQQAAATGIPMSQPLAFGYCNGGANVYTLLSWVEGDEAEGWLARHSPDEGYQLGLIAGAMLRKLHTLAAPPETPEVESQMWAVFNRKLDQYRAATFVIDQEADFLRAIHQGFPYLSGLSQTFLHGDYHVGNMIVSPEGQLQVIDFNRYKFGDPVRDFNRLTVFSRLANTAFARGQIDGYWDGNPPEMFFRRLAFYTAFDTFFAVLWAAPFGAEEMAKALQRAQMVWADFAGFSRDIPRWYEEP